MTITTERDIDVLQELRAATDNHLKVGVRDGWVRPMDCGGSNSSDHSYRLSKLTKLGLAEAKQRMPWAGRGSKVYRITQTGRTLLENINGSA